jgi:hypothetical protein
MSLKSEIKKLEGKALSGDDIIKLCGGRVKIVVYSDLDEFTDLDDLLEPYGSVVILYRTSKNFGHWCGLNMINKNTVEFFDPYAFTIDSELAWVDKNTRKQLEQEHTTLSHLLLASNYNIDYNHIRFQSKERGINTCGRWCSLRCIFKELTLKDFAKLFKCSKGETDWLVTYLTKDA